MSFLSRLSFLLIVSGVQVFSMGPNLTIFTDLDDDVRVVHRKGSVSKQTDIQEFRSRSKSFRQLSSVEIVKDDEQCIVTHRTLDMTEEAFEVFSPRGKMQDVQLYDAVSPKNKKNSFQRIIAAISCRSLPEDL